jgi:hypothetical protein
MDGAPALTTQKASAELYYTTLQEEDAYEELQDEGSKILRKPIIIVTTLFGTINVVLVTLLVIFSQSWYNGIGFITYIFLDTLSGIVACFATYVTEDLQLCPEVSCGILMSCCSGSDDVLRVSRWRVQKAWLFLGALLIWLRPYALYMSILGANVGLGVSFVGHNSCTSNRLDPFGIYHPGGVFPTGEWVRYSRDQAYTFCTMDGRWQMPKYQNQFVRGYIRLIGSQNPFDLNCARESNPGFVALTNNPAYDNLDYTSCPDAYPNPVFGVRGPVIPGTTNTSTALCPGNTNSPVCYDSNNNPFTCTTVSNTVDYPHSIGMPLKVCSVCLNFWRQQAGKPDDPPGYEHCAEYSSSAPMPYACVFCPGRGDGGWLTDEKYSQDDLITAFWLSTVIALINPVVEFFFFWNLLSRAAKKFDLLQKRPKTS